MRSVDVIVPCYNGARFLGQTLDSALSQIHPAVRVLVVDDGSTDGTRAVVETYGGRVDYVAKPNGGQASARNLGIGRTRGEYVLCLDADDLIAPDMVARLVTRLDERPASDLAFVSPLAFFDAGPGRRLPEHGYAETWRPEGPWHEYLAPLSFLCALHTSSTLVRRRAFDRHGLFPEDRAIQGCEDWYLWLKATLEGAGIEHVAGVLSYYRQHATSSSASVRGIATRESELVTRAVGLFERSVRVTERDRCVLSLGMRRIATRWLGLGELDRYAALVERAAQLAPASFRLPEVVGAEAAALASVTLIQVASALVRLGLSRLAAVVLAQTPYDARSHRAVDALGLRADADRLVSGLCGVVASAVDSGPETARPSFFANTAVAMARYESRQGRPDSARKALQTALALDPQHRGAWWAVTMLDARALQPASAMRAARRASDGPARDVALDVLRRVLLRSPRMRQLVSDTLGVSLRTLARLRRHD